MNMNVIMIGDGCMWVRCTNTSSQTNNTKKDRNGLSGYDSRSCMTGKFLKRHICARRHKGVSKEGLRRQGGNDNNLVSYRY